MTLFVNTSVIAKVVTAILLNLDTFDGDDTCRVQLLAVPNDAQKDAGTKIGRKFLMMNERALRARNGNAPHLRRPESLFQHWADATPVEQYAAIRSLLSHWREGELTDTRLYHELNRAAAELAQGIVQDLPEYEAVSSDV